jgi:hypothetical protein
MITNHLHIVPILFLSIFLLRIHLPERIGKDDLELDKLRRILDSKQLSLEEKRFLTISEQTNQLKLQIRKYERQVFCEI